LGSGVGVGVGVGVGFAKILCGVPKGDATYQVEAV
jgi:hypothetical protein